MPRVLIAGCGYVGMAAAKLFLEAGWVVTGWTRSSTPPRITGLAIEAVDISDREQVARHRFGADVVVQCVSTRAGGSDSYRAVYLAGAENLRTNFRTARLILTSSTSVYAQKDGSCVTEESTAEPASETAKILRATEDLVLANKGTVLRVAGIYGPGRSFLLESVLKHRSTGDDRIINQVHRDDVASAIFFVANDQTSGPAQIYNVVDDAPALRSELVQWLSQQLRVRPSEPVIMEARKRGDSNKRVSNAKLRAAGWQLLYPSYREGFQHSVFPALQDHRS